jgi:ABC-2 type transport system ATP-binding protein
MSDNPIISIQNLSKQYKNADQLTLNNISFDIHNNEVFGLLGPNGAGKTTMISILCGVVQASTGTILIDGLDMRRNPNAIKQRIGVVPQDIALYPTLTARENLNFYAAMYGVSAKDAKKLINEWLEKFGLTNAADKKVENYSGGMKRRVNLIASILHQPKVLFLDEPTVGVDVQSRNVIIEHLKDLNQSGMTIIYTSHHMEEAEEFCSRIAIIDYGTILTMGSPKELINSCNGANNLEDVFLDLTKRKLRD